jgi:hypothetical protein
MRFEVRRPIVLVFVGGVLLSCTRSSSTSTTTPSSGTYDVEMGACLCRLPQDELSSCCRTGMELTCRCGSNANPACMMVPTGRTCGRIPPTAPKLR